ncbi:unnamed protein product [Mytilus coruscus]|uniref:C-type lectin domain-containing protein n=1 Tax=Mytilus coruscus TaxID=42192 RepID=A0A6J8EG80_MYTCO|nr:unnamed protein product [Mytilus coruscus]
MLMCPYCEVTSSLLMCPYGDIMLLLDIRCVLLIVKKVVHDPEVDVSYCEYVLSGYVLCQCRAGWKFHNGLCFYFSDDKKTWYEAAVNCRTHRSSLVVVNTHDINTFIVNQISRHGGDYWTDGTDDFQEGEWEWPTIGQLFNFTDWYLGQPDNHAEHGSGSGDCLAIHAHHHHGTWFDDLCTSKLKYICYERMEYKYDANSEMNLKEYFDKNKTKLPQLAIITGGVYGKTKFDDVASDQVVRLHRYITQKRVMAKRSTTREHVLSIPVNSDLKFQVVKGRNNLGPEENLKTILKNNKLPVYVNFTSSRNIFGPDQRPVTNHRKRILHRLFIVGPDGNAQLLITEEFNEYYLQGHCLLDGYIKPDDTTTIIVIPDITIVTIDGFVDQPKEKFQEYLKKMNEQVKSITKFDDHDFDTEIRIIEEKKEAPKPDPEEDSGEDYDYIEPPMPAPRKQSSSEEKPKTTSVGRPLPNIPNNKETPSLPPRGPLPATPSNEVPDKKEQKKNRPYENNNVQHVNPIVKCEDNEAIYEPDIYGDDDYPDGHAVCDMTSPVKSPQVDNTQDVNEFSSDAHDISNKNISDVVEILNKLKLEKYSELFEGDMVDGMTLKNFSEGELKEEYKMRHAEAVRLMNYVRHGHIPK